MAFRFRKSIKIAKGLRVNIGKGSVGLSVGGRGLRYSMNSRGRSTATVGIPGTGISYSQSSSSGGIKSSRSKSNDLALNLLQKRDHLEYTNKYFVKKTPEIYYGQYSALKKKIGIVSIFLLFFFFYTWPILLSCLYLKYFWKKEDEIYVRKYKNAYSSFLKKDYKLCLENINFLMENGKGNDDLYRARAECVLQINNLTGEELQNKIRILKTEIIFLEKEATIDQILNNYPAIFNEITQLKMLCKAGIYNHFSSAQELINAFHDKAFYLNKAIHRKYHCTIFESSDLKTERGKQNRLIKFFEGLEVYDDQFMKNTKDYIKELKDSTFSKADKPETNK